MKKYIIICVALSLLSCGESPKAEQSNTEQETNTIEKTNKEVNINGVWQITKISGGPVKIYPSGKSKPGMEVDFNQIWQGGTYEFTNGICFLTLPNAPKDQIGGYKIQGNTIVFDNTEGEEQKMAFTLEGNAMTLTIDSQAYKNLIAKKSEGQVEMDISSPLVFHLKK